jgi:hypothetical protein
MFDAFVALHRYYIWANRFREMFETALSIKGEITEEDWPRLFYEDIGQLMSYWYSALYVVVEGYQKLKYSDEKVDEMLQSENEDLLRRYRNGVFHFQKKYFDERCIDFIEGPGTAGWARKLNAELGRFFLEKLEERNAGRTNNKIE